MKRQLDITTFFDKSNTKRLKITATIEVQHEPDKKRFNFDDEDATSPHGCRPIIAGASGKLYHEKNKREIPQRDNGHGYFIANVPKASGEKGRDTVCVHRIIWEAFNASIPANMEVDHINDERTDNRLCNLQLFTPSQNSKKMARRSGWISPKHHPVIPVVATCLNECYQKEFKSIYQAAKMLGVNKTCISLILAGKQVTTKAKDGTRYTFHKA